MKTRYLSASILVAFLLIVPLLSANLGLRRASHYGFGKGGYSSQPFGFPPVQYPNGTFSDPPNVEMCEDTSEPQCQHNHVFIYGIQLPPSDRGTVTSITLTVSGQNGAIFSNSPTYGVVVCDNPNDPSPPVPCSPSGAPLTNCVSSGSFVVNETGVGTSTYSQTWNFANCPAFVAGEKLGIFIDLCTPTNTCLNDDPNDFGAPTPVIEYKSDYSEGVTVSISVSRAAQFVAVPPCRLVDTRPQVGGNGPIQGGTSQSFPIQQAGGCGPFPNATAYSLNVTVIPDEPLHFLTVWPTGEGLPGVSILNSNDARVKANAAIVPAGDDGAVSVYASGTTNLVLDINGYFVADTSQLFFYTLLPCRVADTRGPKGDLGGPFLQHRQERKFPIMEASSCNIPPGALAYSLNFTAVPHGGLGFLTVWPTGPSSPPPTSTLNAPTGTVVANAAIVQAGDMGEVSVYPSEDTDLVIDINGYFAPVGDDGLSLYPIVPCRAVDTRLEGGLFSGYLNPPVNILGSSCGVPNTAQVYVLNTTVLPKSYLGFVTMWPDGWTLNYPLPSTLNAWDGAVTSNMAIVGAGYQSMVEVYASDLTYLIVDISSYFAP